MGGPMTDTKIETKPAVIISAAPAPPLSQEEKRKRYELYRKGNRGSKFAVKGDANLHYFWGPKDDSAELVRLDMNGYWIVRCDNPKECMEGKAQPKVQAGGLRLDGTYVIGDVILMACELETYEFALMDVDQSHDEMLSSAKENFLHEAEKQGVPTFAVSK
jgi:hypothetical protein